MISSNSSLASGLKTEHVSSKMKIVNTVTKQQTMKVQHGNFEGRNLDSINKV